MELSAIIERQIAADKRRGFRVDFDTDIGRVAQLEKDLVGLLGEVGEFANLLKKVSLGLDHPSYPGPLLNSVSSDLNEELADTFIYLVRLATILGSDFEKEIIGKMQKNDVRYARLER